MLVDEVAERAVLAAVVLDADVDRQAAEELQPAHFGLALHRVLWTAVQELWAKGTDLDAVVLHTQALAVDTSLDSKRLAASIAELCNETPVVADLSQQVERIRSLGALRAAHRLARQVMTDVETLAREGDVSEWLGKVSLDFQELADVAAGTAAGPALIGASIGRVHELMERAKASEDGVSGLRTGLSDVDRNTTGLHGGEFVIVAARPGIGKTALGLSIARNVCSGVAKIRERERSVLFATLEMPAEQLAIRMASLGSKVPVSDIRSGKMSPEQWERFVDAVGEMSNMPLYVDDQGGLPVNVLRSRALALSRRLARTKAPLGLVVVDYLQLLSAKGESREQQVATASRMLKQLAKELAVPIIAIAQLNREIERRKDARPMLADLRESGQIEQDADIVSFLWRPDGCDESSGWIEMLIAKQRNGPAPTSVRLAYDRKSTGMSNYLSDEPWHNPSHDAAGAYDFFQDDIA